MLLQLVKKFSNVYGNARFTTAVTRAKPLVCNVSQLNPFETFTLHFLRCNQACQVGVEFKRFGDLFFFHQQGMLYWGESVDHLLLDLRGWASWTTSFIYERRSAGASVGPNKSEHYPHGTSLISTTMIYNASSNSHNLHRLCRFTHITVSETVSSFPPGCCINLLGGYCTQLPMISLSLGRWKLLRTWIWGREEIPEINKYVLIKKYV